MGSQQKSKTPFRGSVPFDEMSCADRYALACLTNAFRPQGFSPSRRFNPGATSRLYFTPHPPIGFLGLESSSRPKLPIRLYDAWRASARGLCRAGQQAGPRNRVKRLGIRPPASWHTNTDETRQTRTLEHSFGRASDTPHHAETWRLAAALLAFFPLRGIPTRSLGRNPPLMRSNTPRRHRQANGSCGAHGAPGYLSDRAWGKSRRTCANPHEVCHLERRTTNKPRRI